MDMASFYGQMDKANILGPSNKTKDMVMANIFTSLGHAVIVVIGKMTNNMVKGI
jgi:hypothetical protein